MAKMGLEFLDTVMTVVCFFINLLGRFQTGGVTWRIKSRRVTAAIESGQVSLSDPLSGVLRPKFGLRPNLSQNLTWRRRFRYLINRRSKLKFSCRREKWERSL